MGARALFSFGVITDIQYADIPDGYSFWGIPRYYRHSLQALDQAIASWNKQGNLSFVLQLGDIVDGKCPRENSRSAVEKLVQSFKAFRGGPVHHMLGNHCLYNLPRQQLCQALGIPSIGSDPTSSYYGFSPAPGFRIVVLDGYDISTLGRPADHPHAQAAAEILRKKNPNEDKNSPLGMTTSEKRYVMFNGGVGEEQLRWLEMNLRQATEVNEKVIICCHIPLYHAATFSDTLLWNAEQVMEVVHRFSCVMACFAGHKHVGGYSVDKRGIHHLVLEAVLECPPGENAYGRVDVFEDRLCLTGTGRMASAEMIFARR